MHRPASHLLAGDDAPFILREGRPDSGLLILCDHAGNHIPEEYERLGLPEGELERHIAHDIGAAGVAAALHEITGAPLVMSNFSRLLIDPNRGLDDPTLIMRLSDGAVIPGNADVDAAERARRIARFWRPYDEAISGAIEAIRRRTGRAPVLVSIHTFTPVWRGVPRPWHGGILYDPDAPGMADFPLAVLDALRRRNPALTLGANEPYSGGLPGDTMDRHGVRKGIEHALVEIRQDLVTEEAGQRAWARRVADALAAVLDAAGKAGSNPPSASGRDDA
jgi:predicted N-formylglutamate amidohydrolase